MTVNYSLAGLLVANDDDVVSCNKVFVRIKILLFSLKRSKGSRFSSFNLNEIG